MDIQRDCPLPLSRRRQLERFLRHVAAAACITSSLTAQESAPIAEPSETARASVRWTVAAPDASTAWFSLLADLRLGGAGAFQFVAPPANRARQPVVDSLARALAQSRQFEILHFVPLYYPSAERSALAAALRAAAATPARAPVPRAELVVAALVSALTSDARRDNLPALASALEAVRVAAPAQSRLQQWQERLDALYVPALTPWLRLERLDVGRLIISDAIGAEGRIFTGTTDRADNLIAVGAMSDDPDPDAPLFAFTREACYPAVTRAATRAKGFDAADVVSARRTSLAAVRCGADLLDQLLPARADAYRAYWLRRAGQPSEPARFDAVFPPDPALRADVATSLQRVAGSPR